MPEIEQKVANKDDMGVFTTLALHMITHAQQDPRIVRLAAFTALEGPQFARIFQRGGSSPMHISESLAGYIQQRIDEGAFKNVNARIAARLFIETIFMHAVDQEVSLTGPPVSFSLEETVDTLVQVFLGGLKA